jgi:predicted unusual protein kinase regulating ubiquinone biosynthesis (AarF/ABC1/UbiB family)
LIHFLIWQNIISNIIEMKELNSIPTGKVQRASKFLKTGAKVGGNYVKHYTRRVFDGSSDKSTLHEDNAKDIYESLSKLKGGALKVAQMMSLDQGILPAAYQDKFAQAQYSAPPLSFPLITKTFKDQLGKDPFQLYDSFSKKAVNAASIGQVHEGTLNEKKLAIKIQYPGVADSLKSDLKIVKPFARMLFNISDKDIEYYMAEVEHKLLEETDYELEVKRSIEISTACSHLAHLRFPTYYPDLSAGRIITMDWMEGMHLDAFLATNPSQEVRNKAGQALWDFYDYQVHVLKMLHADAHPGNYLFAPDGSIAVIDFGCVKEIPEDFYHSYFRIHDRHFAANKKKFDEWLYELEYIIEEDSPIEKKLFAGFFREMVDLIGKPFHSTTFDFGDEGYFRSIYELGQRISSSKEVRRSNAGRGARDGIYINRTYFGLFHILHSLKANINTKSNTFVLAS